MLFSLFLKVLVLNKFKVGVDSFLEWRFKHLPISLSSSLPLLYWVKFIGFLVLRKAWFLKSDRIDQSYWSNRWLVAFLVRSSLLSQTSIELFANRLSQLLNRKTRWIRRFSIQSPPPLLPYFCEKVAQSASPISRPTNPKCRPNLTTH